MKKIDTLVEDIYAVVEGRGGWDATVSKFLAESVVEVAEERFSKPPEPRGYLSLSSLGTPCRRKLWYKVNMTEHSAPLGAEALGTFFYGDLLEALVISLAMAAGHKVEGMQDKVDVHGIKGHRDVVIDGVTVDVKSASNYGFIKFAKGSLREDDPFGYISQLSSYVYAGKDDPVVKDKKRGAFLAIRKERFKLALDMYDFTEELEKKEEEVEDLKAMVKGDIPEGRVEPVDHNKKKPNGNKVLDTQCSYCEFKKICWPKARKFIYSSGPIWFTHVEKEPNVVEIIE